MVDCEAGAFSVRDDSLAIYLGQVLEESLNRSGYLIFNEHNTLKLLLQDMLDEMPLTPQKRRLLRANDRHRQYVCVSMHSTAAAASTTIYSNYICNLFETNFPNSIAFAYRHTVVGFIELSYYLGAHGEYQNKLSHALHNLLETLQVFLEENMSYNRTAEILYIYRSTLTDRIARIERDLGLDLTNPNERLQLMILFKAMEINEIIRNQS